MAQTKELSGISITLDMDISRFNKAMDQVKKYTSQLDKDLKNINKALELNPDSVETLKAKFSKLLVETEKVAEQITLAEEQKRKFTSDSGQWARANADVMEYSKKYDDLQEEIKKTKEALDNLANGGSNAVKPVEEVSDEVKELKAALEEANEEISQLKSSEFKEFLSDVANVAKTAAETIAKVFTWEIKSLYNIFKEGVEYNAEIEQYTALIKSNLNGDTDAAQKLVKEMKNLSQLSGMSASNLLNATNQLIAAGDSADEAASDMTLLVNALSKVGASNDVLDRMGTNLAQIKSLTHATKTDLNQFAKAGIPIWKLLAEYSDKFTGDFKATEVAYEDLIGALQKGFDSSAFEISANTLTGQINRLQTNWDEFLGILASDTTSSLSTEVLPAINDFLSVLIGTYQTADEQLQASKEEFVRHAGGHVYEEILPDETAMDKMADALVENIRTLIERIANSGLISTVLEATTTVIGAIEDAFKEGTTEGDKNRQSLQDLIEKIADLLIDFVKLNYNAFVKVGSAIADPIVEGISKSVGDYLSELAGYDYAVSNGVAKSYTSSLLPQHSGGFGSLNFGALASGGFTTGGITLNASFNMANTQLNENSAKYLANIMVDEINNKLGGMV